MATSKTPPNIMTNILYLPHPDSCLIVVHCCYFCIIIIIIIYCYYYIVLLATYSLSFVGLAFGTLSWGSY